MSVKNVHLIENLDPNAPPSKIDEEKTNANLGVIFDLASAAATGISRAVQSLPEIPNRQQVITYLKEAGAGGLSQAGEAVKGALEYLTEEAEELIEGLNPPAQPKKSHERELHFSLEKSEISRENEEEDDPWIVANPPIKIPEEKKPKEPYPWPCAGCGAACSHTRMARP